MSAKKNGSAKRAESAQRGALPPRLEKLRAKPDVYCRLKAKKYVFAGAQNHNFQKYGIDRIDTASNTIHFKSRTEDESALDSYQNQAPLAFTCPKALIADTTTNAELHSSIFEQKVK